MATLRQNRRPVAVTVGQDNTMRVWDLADGTRIDDPLTGHDGRVPVSGLPIGVPLARSPWPFADMT